jgi:hypothetical protein
LSVQNWMGTPANSAVTRPWHSVRKKIKTVPIERGKPWDNFHFIPDLSLLEWLGVDLCQLRSRVESHLWLDLTRLKSTSPSRLGTLRVGVAAALTPSNSGNGYATELAFFYFAHQTKLLLSVSTLPSPVDGQLALWRRSAHSAPHGYEYSVLHSHTTRVISRHIYSAGAWKSIRLSGFSLRMKILLDCNLWFCILIRPPPGCILYVNLFTLADDSPGPVGLADWAWFDVDLFFLKWHDKVSPSFQSMANWTTSWMISRYILTPAHPSC